MNHRHNRRVHGEEPTGWYRIVAPGGSVWFETQDEAEARSLLRRGDRLEAHWRHVEDYWVPVVDVGPGYTRTPVIGH